MTGYLLPVRMSYFFVYKFKRGDGKLKGLTVKQKKFADEYIITGNATESAIKAGYSKKYANTNASKLLQNTTLKLYVDERLAELDSEKIADQKEVLQYLTSVMRGKETEQTLRGMGEGYQQLIDIEVGATQRIRAAELIGKRHSMWTDKVDVSGSVVFITGDDEIED